MLLLRPSSLSFLRNLSLRHLSSKSMTTSPSSHPPPPTPIAPTERPQLPSPLVTVVCTTPAEIKRCMTLRQAVFVEEQGYPARLKLHNEKDVQSLHLLLHSPSSNTDLATVRLYLPESKMGRLAVALAYRKTGAGRKMVEALEEAVRRGELSGMARVEGEEEVRIKAHVQRGLLGFYEKCGYRQEGGEIDEDGIPHFRVVKSIVLE